MARDFRIDKKTGRKFQKINYQDPNDMKARLQDPSPFAFALAEANDYNVKPHSVKTVMFVAVPGCWIKPPRRMPGPAGPV